MALFVTDTAIIDIRNGDIIQAGQPFEKEAMHDSTFSILSRKNPPEVLPFTPDNVCILNPRLVNRHQVFTSMGAKEMPRVQPKNVRDLITVLPEDSEPEQPGEKRSLIVGVKGEPVQAPPAEVPTTAEAASKSPVQNVWVYDPATLEQHQEPELQATLIQRCGEFELPVPNIGGRENLIAYLSKDYVAPPQS